MEGWHVQHLGVAIFRQKNCRRQPEPGTQGFIQPGHPIRSYREKCSPGTCWSFVDQTVTKICQDLARPACPKFGCCYFLAKEATGGRCTPSTQEPKGFVQPGHSIRSYRTQCGPGTCWSFWDQHMCNSCQDLARPACLKFGGCYFWEKSRSSHTQEPRGFVQQTSGWPAWHGFLGKGPAFPAKT